MPVTIRSLHVYPVKGCAAVDVDRITFDADGLIVGDRQAMIVDEATGEFISQRHEPKLATLRAYEEALGFLRLETPVGRSSISFHGLNSTRRVTVWEDTFDAVDCGDRPAEFLSDWLGRRVRLVMMTERPPRTIDPYWAGDDARSSFADLAPILVTSITSLDDLNARRVAAGASPVEMMRFRPNVVLGGLPPWAEDRVESLRLRRGMSSLIDRGVGLRFIKPCARCNVVELDPATGDATGDEVLKSLAGFRAGRNRRGTAGIFFGQNAVVRGGGGWSLSVGERLRVVGSPIC